MSTIKRAAQRGQIPGKNNTTNTHIICIRVDVPII